MADRSADNPQGAHVPEDSGLWLDEGKDPNARHGRSRRAWATISAVACLLLVGVPVGLLVATTSRLPAHPHTTRSSGVVHLGGGPAERSVLAALSATTDSGSFDFTYDLSESPGTSTTTTTACGYAYGSSCPTSSPDDTAVVGSGIIDANPMAMAASASISQNGTSGLQVGVRVNSTTVWEVGSTDNGLTPVSTDDGSGQPLPEFAGLTEGALGEREGAVAMMGMASPTGYLDLVQPAISGAAEVGTSTVDGVPVTQYELAIDPSSLSTGPNVSSAEASTINDALSLLSTEGFTTIRDLVSIDASGFIRQSSSTLSFSDGGTVTLDAQFSNFGCAGMLLMPGEGGTSLAPPNCSSPDTALTPFTPTTTSGPVTPTSEVTSTTTTTTTTIPTTTTTTTTGSSITTTVPSN
jgi:hypothetical protein